MIRDAQSQGDLIAALHLESWFNSARPAGIADESHGMTGPEPAIPFQNEHDAVDLRLRLAFINRLAIAAKGLSFRADKDMTGSIETSSSAASRAAATVANWRSYLAEDCVAAMIKNGWQWTT